MASQSAETEPLLQAQKRTTIGPPELENGAHEELPIAYFELGLRRSLSIIDGVSLLVGIIIGSGIFTSPGVVLLDAGSVGLGLTSWIAAAFMALCSALIYAELGAAFPQAGGNAGFYKVAFGDSVAFSFIWTMFFVLTNGSLAIIAITFSRYIVAGIRGVNPLEGDMDSDPVVKAVAIGCVAFVTIWNCFGVHVGAAIQNVISLMKLLLIALLAVAAVVFVRSDPSVVESNFHEPFAGSTFSSFAGSCVAAVWAFSGWGDLVFLTEELKDPARDIPRGTIGSILLVAVIYLIINMTYLCILPAAVLKTSAVVAIDATKTALGPWASSITSILVGISVLGTANGIIICGARYLYSAAREGHVPKSLGMLGTESRAPYVAHLVQGVLCILLLLQSSNFVELLSYFAVSSFFFYGLSAAAHMKIRHDYPDLHRPYTVGFYPYAPLIVMCSTLYLVVSTLVTHPLPTCLSLAFIVISFPVYYLFIEQPQIEAHAT